MQYRSKHYIVTQGIEPNSWKWTVDLDERISKSGEAKPEGWQSAPSSSWSTSC
jgi:hypothetical protein